MLNKSSILSESNHLIGPIVSDKFDSPSYTDLTFILTVKTIYIDAREYVNDKTVWLWICSQDIEQY